MVTLQPKRGRPISYSESHIQLDRVRTYPLLSPSSSMVSFEIEQDSPPVPIVLHIPIHSPSPSPSSPHSEWIPFLHSWALRFVFHLTLISLFETVFFWQFISKSEDGALIALVNHYAASTLNGCKTLTPNQRQLVTDFMDLFINQTRVDIAGSLAATSRATYNNILVRNSWLYFGGFLIVFAGLGFYGHLRGYRINWRSLLLENLALVSFLGFYEWMFFSTVVLRYQAISVPELDRMVVDEIMSAC